MPAAIQRFPLPAVAIGTNRELVAFRYGAAGARPRVYMQAALHADELPGQLVLHRLRRTLDLADAEGRIRGEILLVPVANPIGLAQVFDGKHLGRYEAASGDNFNRGYPDLASVGDEIEARLTADAEANLAVVRAAMRARLEAEVARDELQALRLLLLRLAVDADVALDLHCDSEAEMHVYLGDLLWPSGADLCAELGARAVLLARSSGGNPFDEAISAAFAALSERFGTERPIRADACLSPTVELRGEADVADRYAEPDAAALYRFLCRRGVIDDSPGPPPAALCEATPLSATEIVRATAPGVIVYRAEIGQVVRAGDPIAEIVDPTAPDAGQPGVILRARTDGRFFARALDRLGRPGRAIGKIAGRVPLADRKGKLLTD